MFTQNYSEGCDVGMAPMSDRGEDGNTGARAPNLNGAWSMQNPKWFGTKKSFGLFWLHGWSTMLNIVEVRIPNFWSVCPYLSCRFFVQVILEDSMEFHEPRLIASNFHSAETHVGVDRLSRAAAQSVENWNSNRMSLVQSLSLSLYYILLLYHNILQYIMHV